VLGAPVVGADETTWPLLEKGGGRRWYAWSIASGEAVCYRIDPSRSARAAGEILRDYKGVVVADGYGAYAALFYSLVESAKLAGVEPAAYLAEATRRAIASPGTVSLPRDLDSS